MLGDRTPTGPWGFITLLAATLAGIASTARADRIVLRGGGQIRGVVLPEAEGAEEVAVQAEALTNPIRYRKDQIVEVVPEPTPLHEYLERRARAGPGAQEQFDLGRWAADRKLPEYARLHFERAVEADPSFGPAHRELGHVQHAGRWITADELREAQGLVKHRGRWISLEEKEAIDAEQVAQGERLGWSRRIQVLRQALRQGDPDRRREAEEQLLATRDPAAVDPLVRAFVGDPGPYRELLARALGNIEGPEAALALVGRVLAEAEPGPREAALRELALRDDPEVVPQLVRALRVRDTTVINRAAWALAQLDAVEAAPRLVPVLVLVERKMVWMPTTTPSAGNVGPGGYGSSFFTGTTVPLASLDSVAVGPGAVGFGASAVPFAAGIGMGTVPADPPGMTRGRSPRFVAIPHRNIQVLNALRDLTGQDFGFDAAAWSRWLTTAFKPDPRRPGSSPSPERPSGLIGNLGPPGGGARRKS